MKRVVANDAASIFLLANIVSITMEVGVCNRIMQKSTELYARAAKLGYKYDTLC